MSSALAREVVSVELDRQHNGKLVVMSALVDMAPQPNGKALMVFPGWPGIPRIEEREGVPAYFYLQEHVEEMRPTLAAAGISTVTVDCPTDQWGRKGFNPTACDDSYRSSPQHAQDVAALIAKLKRDKSLQHITIMGHSYGAVSSHWLALRLNQGEIQAAIHSSTQSMAGGGPYVNYAASLERFDHAAVKVPTVYLHHRDDLCKFTPYSYAQKNAKAANLITVVGGSRWSDPCGKASYHGFSERRAELAQALVAYVNRGEVMSMVKGEKD